MRAAWIMGLAMAVACGGSKVGGPLPGETPVASEQARGASVAGDGAVRFRVETFAAGLQVPWSIVFLPDGRMLVAERAGRLRLVENGRLRPQPFATVPGVEPSGESGLTGLALHPKFAENHLLYLAYAYRGDGGLRVRVARFRMTDSGLEDAKALVENIPAASVHTGTRVAFGPDGKLYVTTGDSAERSLAQRLDSLAGKTLRLDDDGSIPQDNPFVGRAGARPEIWSYGHRNAEGIDWQPGTGVMFQTEHGPSGFDGPGGGDEVNVVERGKNYGWPTVHHRETREGLESPLLEYTPAVAPASGMFYTGSLFPALRGNYLFGCLRGECMIRVVLDRRRVVRQERLLDHQYGRIREVAQGPDGALYVTTSNRDGRGSPTPDDDRILKLVPEG